MKAFAAGLTLVVACAAPQGAIDVRVAQSDTVARAQSAMRNRELHDSGLVLGFWPVSDSARVDTTRYRVSEHPCGSMLVTRVRAIPIGDSVLVPEVAVEFAADGRVIRQWSLPIDRTPLAIEADELVITLDDSNELGVGPNGAIRVLPMLKFAGGLVEHCPSIGVFKGSAYTECARFLDLRSGVARHIAYQGICT
jgi:hypothetical protein